MFKDTSYSFFTLPAELRIKVYKMCMVDHDDKMLDWSLIGGLHVKSFSAALLRTCRVIYEETMPVLYGNRVLRIQPKANLKECLESMSTTARANIKELSMVLQDSSRDDNVAHGPYCKLRRDVLIQGAEDREFLGLLRDLKRVTLVCGMKWTKDEWIADLWEIVRLDRPPHKIFIESLRATEIEQDCGLHALMQQFPHHEHIQWQLQLSSCEYYVHIDDVPFPRRNTVQVNAKISVRKDGQSVERWVVERMVE